jgi:hypothetical protein
MTMYLPHNLQIGAVRHLDEVWGELSLLIESESVELNIAPVVAPPITKLPKPAVGNQLGTMTPAIAA